MRGFRVGPRATGWRCLYRLFVEPDVFHTPAVVDAVDHDGQAPDLGVPAVPAAAEIKQWLGVVLDEAALDVADDVLALFLVGLAGTAGTPRSRA